MDVMRERIDLCAAPYMLLKIQNIGLFDNESCYKVDNSSFKFKKMDLESIIET